MDYVKALRALAKPLTHAEIAAELGVSVAKLRQAQLPETSEAYRRPPENWRFVLAQLADRRELYFRQLAARLRSEAE